MPKCWIDGCHRKAETLAHFPKEDPDAIGARKEPLCEPCIAAIRLGNTFSVTEFETRPLPE